MKLSILSVVLLLIFSCKESKMNQTIAFRLKPGEDLKNGIERVVAENKIQAGWIITAVGSLTDYHIRFANQAAGTKNSGHFEIVSLTGTLGMAGNHIHISVSDSTGKTIGGHLLEDNKVYTTAEIVIGISGIYKFSRENDGSTPWKELQINKQ
jgi:predicted DNA-binding protein with PD1-like motif